MFISEQKRTITAGIAVAFLIAVVTPILLVGHTKAASLLYAGVKFDRMKAATATTGTVCAKPTTASTEATVDVTFPASTTLGLVGTFTVDTVGVGTTAWPAGAAAWVGIDDATSVSGDTVTFPSGELVVDGTLYCFNWNNSAAVTTGAANPNETGTIETYTSGAALIDSGTYATAFIADDQIVVTASVAPTFAFSLSGNSDAIGAVTVSTPVSGATPRTATIATNANNGWAVWAKDLYTGLYSAAANYTIDSTTPGTVSTLSAGTQGYNTGVANTSTTGAGVVTIATPFDKAATAFKGGGLNTSFQMLASSTGGNTTALELTNSASVSPTSQAASDYTDTITVVAAGLF